MANTPVPISGANTIVGYNVTVPFVETDVYTFSFPYLDQANFELVVNSETTLTTDDYEFTSEFVIQLTTVGVDKLNALYGAFTTDIAFLIRRRTELTVQLVDYTDGGTLTEEDLDLASDQAFYLIQEVFDSSELGNISFNPIDGKIDIGAVELINLAYPTSQSSATTLESVLDNVITPEYAENDVYKEGRLVFYASDLYRANKEVNPAPAVFVPADFDIVFTAADSAQILQNTTDIGTNATAIGDNATNLSNHESATSTHGVTEIVGRTEAQTLTNKTLTAPAITSPTGIVKADVGLSNVDNTSDVTKDAAATTLTNKTVTGASIVNPVRSDVKNDTKANLDIYAGTASNSQFCFATDEKKMYQVVDSALTSVGGGGGGGLDTFHTETFEETEATDFTTGQGVPDAVGTGTANGVLSDDAATNISGTNSLKFVEGVTSTNDFFIVGEDLVTSDKQDSNDMKVSFYSKFDGTTGNIRFFVLDQDDNELTSILDTVEASDKAQRHEFGFYIPSGTTAIRYGFQVVTGESGAIFIADDLELTMKPYVYADINETEDATYSVRGDANGRASTNTAILYCANEVASSVGNIITIDNSATLGLSVTANKRCEVTFTLGAALSGASWLGISKNATGSLSTNVDSLTDTQTAAIVFVGSVNDTKQVTYTGILEEGDVLRPHTRTSATIFDGNLESLKINITATATSEHVVTPAKSRPNSYSARIANNGTASMTSVDVDFGTVVRNSVGKTTITFNTDLFSVAPVVTVTPIHDNTNEKDWNILVLTDSLVEIYTKVAGTGTDIPYTVTVRRQDEDYVENFGITATPVQKVAYLKDEKSAGSNGGTFTAGEQTRVLNVVSGDTSIVSLSANQFTLGKGKYIIEGTAPAFRVNAHALTLYNITTSSNLAIGSIHYTNSSNSYASNDSSVYAEVTITTSTVFELRHNGQTTFASQGFGVGTAFGSDVNVFAQVKITKLR